MFSIFAKKNKFKASCDLSRVPLEKESTYILTTAQIISSKKFWDNVMTEPDTMTYTEAHFKSGDETAMSIRKMIYKKYAAQDKPWVIGDAQIHLFDVDEEEAKKVADQWWESNGTELPGKFSKSLSDLGPDKLSAIENYAIQEAGRRMVQL